MQFSSLFTIYFLLCPFFVVIAQNSPNYTSAESRLLLNVATRDKTPKETEDIIQIFVVNQQGCEGCINEGIKFVKRYLLSNKSDGKTMILLTNILYLKLLKLRFGDYLKDNRVVIDSKNILKGTRFESIYPLKIQFRKNKIVEVIPLDTAHYGQW